MKKYLYSVDKMIKTFIVMSFVMFICLAISPKVASIGLAVWVFNVFWIAYLLVRGNVDNLVRQHSKQIVEAKEKKEYFKFGIYSIALPMCAVGIVFIIIDLVAMFML